MSFRKKVERRIGCKERAYEAKQLMKEKRSGDMFQQQYNKAFMQKLQHMFFYAKPRVLVGTLLEAFKRTKRTISKTTESLANGLAKQ